MDFLSYPERLSISELVPKMVNGVLLAQCVRVGRREREVEEEQHDPCDSFMIEVQDSTGEGCCFVNVKRERERTSIK